MTQFNIGDRVRIHDRRFGELAGSVLFISDQYITARLDKPRKKLHPADRAYELTAPKRCWQLIPHFEVKTADGSFRLHNHKARQASAKKKEELAKWRESCLQSSQS